MANFRGLDLRQRLTAMAAAICVVVLTASAAQAHGFSGIISYRGARGPVGFERPLCLCVYADAQLRSPLGCLLFRFNDAPFNLDLGDRNLYLVAFLDLEINERLDAGEPFEIFADRGAPPADPVAGESGRTDINFVFGDENLPATPTSTPLPTSTPPPTHTLTPSATSTASRTPTATSRPATRTPTPTCALPDDPACVCTGDCNGNGQVAVNELITVVRVALGITDTSVCEAGDANRDGTAQVGEVVRAVRRSLDGC